MSLEWVQSQIPNFQEPIIALGAIVSSMTVEKSSKKRPGIEQQRHIILSAAISLFGSKGASAVSITDVCKAAKVSRDTFYRCFTDKETLISHLYQTAVNDHIEAVLGASNLNYDNRQWLDEVFDQTIDAILEQHQIAQFLFVESANPDSHAYQVIQLAYDKVAARMQQWSKAQYGKAPGKEFFMALLVASQWLVHNAIVKGMSRQEVKKAKLAAKQLYFAAFSSIPKE